MCRLLFPTVGFEKRKRSAVPCVESKQPVHIEWAQANQLTFGMSAFGTTFPAYSRPMPGFK